MQLKQLAHFLAAIDHGSISGAAESQHVTQPALTRSIRKLEQAVGAQLLERGRLGVVPTTYGRALAERARVIVNEAEQATGELAAMRSGRLGTVRLGLGPGIATDALLATLARCARNRADVVLALHIGYPDLVFGMLRRGELDALVTLRPVGSLDPDLHFEPLAPVTSVVVARAAHPFARERRHRSLAELASAAWAVYSQRGFEDFWRTVLRLDERSLPMLRIRCNTPTTIKQIVLSGDYLALLSRPIVEAELRRGEIVEIHSELAPIVTQACIVTRRRAAGTAALEFVLGELRRLDAERRRGGNAGSAGSAGGGRGGNIPGGKTGRAGRPMRKSHGKMNSRA